MYIEHAVEKVKSESQYALIRELVKWHKFAAKILQAV